MTKRQTALILAKVAGYHQDSRTFWRVWVEYRVSKPALQEAWALGVRARQAGVRCECIDCQPKAGAA